MTLNANTLLMILIASVVLAILLALHAEWRLRRLLRGAKGDDLEEAIVRNAGDIEKFRQFRAELEQYLESVEKRLKESVRGVATVRFNPFKGTGGGGNQSFASSFLSENGDGLIISSLYSRERVSVYAKPLKNFKSEYELTDEEKLSLQKARRQLQSNSQ